MRRVVGLHKFWETVLDIFVLKGWAVKMHGNAISIKIIHTTQACMVVLKWNLL